MPRAPDVLAFLLDAEQLRMKSGYSLLNTSGHLLRLELQSWDPSRPVVVKSIQTLHPQIINMGIMEKKLETTIV